MTKTKIVINVLSVISTVATVALSVCFICVPINDSYLFNFPILFNIMRILVVLRIVLIIVTAFFTIDKLKMIFNFRTFIGVSSAVAMVFCSFFALNAYTNCRSFHQSSNTSLLNQSYNADSEIQEFLPYYDYFYEKGGSQAHYSISGTSTKQCTQIKINNRLFDLEVDSPSYSVSYFKSNIKLLLYKFRFEENFNGFSFTYFREWETAEHTTVTVDDAEMKIYSNDDGYSAVVNGKKYMCYIRLSNINKAEISFNEFSATAMEQMELINLLAEMEDVPGAQNMNLQ